METPTQIRLVFQGSIPFGDNEHAREWYAMLREMVKSQDTKSTLNGQLLQVLEPCCGDRKGAQSGPRFSSVPQR